MSEPKPITWHTEGPNTFAAQIGKVQLVLMRCPVPSQLNSNWSLTMDRLLVGKPMSGIPRDDVRAAQKAALRLAEETLKPYAEAYSDIVEEGMR